MLHRPTSWGEKAPSALLANSKTPTGPLLEITGRISTEACSSDRTCMPGSSCWLSEWTRYSSRKAWAWALAPSAISMRRPTVAAA